MAGESYELEQDTRYGCVRTARLKIKNYEVSILYNEVLGHAGVNITKPASPFAPKITRMPDAGFSFYYGHTVIFDENRPEFESEYRNAVEFCAEAKGCIDAVLEKLRLGAAL